MKILSVVFVISAFIISGCHDKFVRKSMSAGDIQVKWYFYSYISNISPEIIEVTKGNEEIRIYEATDVITDVLIKGDSIVIQLFEPERGVVYTERPMKHVFGYSVVFDSTATVTEYDTRPPGKKEQ